MLNAEQYDEARYWVAEQFPGTTVADDELRGFVHRHYPAGGWPGFIADNYL